MTFFLIRSFAASGTATLYTSPAGTQSVTAGQTFTVNVRIGTGASVPVTGASVYLSYPTAKLQVVGESYTGSPYTTQLVASDSGGVLRLDRAAFPMVAGGDQLYAQVTFKAIAAGSAPIAFTASSVVTSGEDDSNILTQKTGVTYNVTAPATPPASSGSTSTGSSGSSSSGSSGASSGSASTTHSGSSGSSPTPSKPGSTTPAAGGSSGSAGSGSSQGTAPTGSTTTAAGDSGTSGNSTAAALQVTILDSRNKPVEGAVVTVDGQTATTDKNGVAHFTSVPAGKQTLAVTFKGKKTTKAVQVKSASPQLFKVSITKDKFNPALLVLPVIILLGAGVFFLRPAGLKFASAHATEDVPAVVTSGHPAVPVQTPASRKLETPGTVYAPQTPASPPAPPSSSDDSGVKQPPAGSS